MMTSPRLTAPPFFTLDIALRASNSICQGKGKKMIRLKMPYIICFGEEGSGVEMHTPSTLGSHLRY